jgi:hypothetical protein
MACPRRGCGGTLTRWGYGRRRRVRGLGDHLIEVRPRRVRCGLCAVTQVLLPAGLQPRRADATEVIGTALVRKAAGVGVSSQRWAAHRPRCAGGCAAPATALISPGFGNAVHSNSSDLTPTRSTSWSSPATCCAMP